MDKGSTSQLYGNYRAKVVSNKDKENFGRVLVWIPDLMQNIPDTQGLWARPANNPIGGRNKAEGTTESYYGGTSYIPANGSWVWTFFEAGNINRPYYFAGLDLQNAPVLPENRVGGNPSDKWVIFKSGSGRTVVISDDPTDARVEITGQKKLLEEPPSGDTFSVYRIDENQTTLLLDERSDTEKILIKTHEGDFIKLGIKNRTLEIQVASNIKIKTGGHVQISASGDQHIMAGQNMYLSAKGSVNIVAGGNIMSECKENYGIKCGNDSAEDVGKQKVLKAKEEIFIKSDKGLHEDGTIISARYGAGISDNSGGTISPPDKKISAGAAIAPAPVGDRDKA